ncbi:MAG TPA: hypothetical protein VEK06_04975, partial [Myxococcota bacterium]|nr:hypothetical protein [Myxococcota bacterium]
SSDPKEAGKGSVTWTIENIDLEHKDEVAVYTDCQGEAGLWQGKASIMKAKKTMYGRLTGDAKKPVIPDVGTLTIEVQAKAHDLSIRFPNKEGHLKLKEGDFSFVARPRLAQNNTGMRLTPTSNTKFEKVRLLNVAGELTTKDVIMPVTINESDMNIQVGEGEDGNINSIAGSITIFGNKRDIPTDGKGLDPHFEAEKFRATYACHSELKGVISYSHIPLENKLASGTAGLTARLMASIAGMVEEDVDCGLSSAEAVSSTTINGVPGEKGASNTALRRPCIMVLKNQMGKANCFGEAEQISGRISVIDASKNMQGVVVFNAANYKKSSTDYTNALQSGDLSEASKLKPKPIFPNTTRPVELKFTVELNDIEVRPVCLNEGNIAHPLHCQYKKNLSEQPVFRVKNGRVEARIKPLLGKSLDGKEAPINFCAQKTRAGEAIINIVEQNSSIERDGFILNATSKGSFSAVNGQVGTSENELKGSLSIGGKEVAFKSKEKDFLALDPQYERQAFLDSFMSCKKMAMVASDDQCKPEFGLSVNVARLLVQNAGSLLKISSYSKLENSFASKFAVLNRLLSDDGKTVHLPAKMDVPFDLTDANLVNLRKSYDAFNTKTVFDGTVESLHGKMTRRGIRINEPTKIMGLNINPFSNRYVEAFDAQYRDKKEIFVRPIEPDSTDVTIEASVKNFTTRVVKDERTEPSIKIHEAQFKIEARPFFGVDKRTESYVNPSYSIATPVVKFKRIEIHDAPLVLKANGMTIPIYVKEATLKAHNGRFAGEGNYIEGSIAMKIVGDISHPVADVGALINVPRQDLLPDGYDQARFDQSYAHTKYLQAPLQAD